MDGEIKRWTPRRKSALVMRSAVVVAIGHWIHARLGRGTTGGGGVDISPFQQVVPRLI